MTICSPKDDFLTLANNDALTKIMDSSLGEKDIEISISIEEHQYHLLPCHWFC